MSDAAASPRVLLVTGDLMVSSRLGSTPGLAVSADLAAAPFDAILLDLGSPGPAGAKVAAARELAGRLGPPGGRALVIAFGPHVARERLAEAEAAGADRVVSRGEALGALPALLATWLGRPAAGPG